MSIFKRKTSPAVFVDDLSPVSDCFKIRVQIIKLWDGFKGKGGSSLEMVLVDEKVYIA